MTAEIFYNWTKPYFLATYGNEKTPASLMTRLKRCYGRRGKGSSIIETRQKHARHPEDSRSR